MFIARGILNTAGGLLIGFGIVRLMNHDPVWQAAALIITGLVLVADFQMLLHQRRVRDRCCIACRNARRRDLGRARDGTWMCRSEAACANRELERLTTP